MPQLFDTCVNDDSWYHTAGKFNGVPNFLDFMPFHHDPKFSTHWLASDLEATWQKLVNCVALCKENVIAGKLARDVGASYQGTGC